MIEVAIAIGAALYTARLVVRDAMPRRERPRGRVRRAAPPAAVEVDGFADLVDLDATQAVDVSALLAGSPAPTGAERAAAVPSEIMPSGSTMTLEQTLTLGAPLLRPDPDRLIQTEVILPTGSSARVVAIARLVGGIALLGVLLGVGSLGLVRAAQALLRGP